MRKKHITFRINMVSAGVFIIAALIAIMSLRENYNIKNCIKEQFAIEGSIRKCQKYSQDLMNASDYLTSQAGHFAVTRQTKYMEEYWEEIHGAKQREKASKELMKQSLTNQEKEMIEKVIKDSDELINQEAWTFRLVAESIGLNAEQMPKEVKAVVLTPEEELLSAVKKQDKALSYLFGGEYRVLKKEIRKQLGEFHKVLNQRKEHELLQAVRRTKQAFKRTIFYDLIIILLVFATVMIYYYLAARPLKCYAGGLRKIREGKFTALKPMGSRETRGFAEMFNELYSDLERQNRLLREERFRFHAAIENTKDIIYEYDFAADTFTFYGALEEYNIDSSYPPNKEQQISRFFCSDLDFAATREDNLLLKDFISNDQISSIEMRIRIAPNRPYLWSRITGTHILDDAGDLVKVIGKITNIEQEKEREILLEEARNRDSLTGFYNKEAGVKKVQQYLLNRRAEQVCCLMFLDMDNFEQINEAEGRVFADTILQETADIIRAKTSPDDILIRLGGDEFMLFILGCTKKRAVVLGPKIAEEIRKLTAQQIHEISISASIGMCTTEVVVEYSGLYRCAESTLKYVKENKKGCAACYLDTSNELGMMLTQMYPDVHYINDIDGTGHTGEDLISLALDLLGKSKNLDDAIFLLLARVGKFYNLDKVSIIQIDAEYLSYHFRYQWTRNKADSQMGKNFYAGKSDLEQIMNAYDAEGLCERYVIPDLAAMKSILHAGIWNQGTFYGIMSFETYKEGRVWCLEERKVLNEMVKIISSFILKARADAVSQAKTDFLSRMSHEIRTPMNAITGMTAIAKERLLNPDKVMECLNKIDSANVYLLSLINDILDMSRIESGRMELHTSTVSLYHVLEELDVLMRPQAEAKELIFEVVKPELSKDWLLTDKLRLNQILVNLLSNAIKFTPPKGRVVLEVRNIAERPEEVTLRFSVADTGIGIAPETQKRVFEAFEQAASDTAASYGGTGLGLPIADKLVQMLGGTLKVHSSLGEGAEFSFTLNILYAAEAEEQKPIQKESSFDTRGRKILVAEDNEINREIAKTILTMHGYQVEEAVDGREAVNIFRDREAFYYDAILMDIRMPVMDGMEAARAIRTMKKLDSRRIPIIAMTANAFDEDMKKSIENGMNAHLSKPMDVELLLKTLAQCITNKKEYE